MRKTPATAAVALSLLALCSTRANADSSTATSASPAYSFNFLYTGELWDVASGGMRRGPSYIQNIDGQFQVDTAKAFGWTGGRFFFESFYANRATTSSSYVGSLDQISPIDTNAGISMFRLYQVYYEQAFGTSNLRFGVYDLETEFGNTRPMSLFLNKNLTWNTAFDQSGTMPSNGTIGPGNYPFTPLAVRFQDNLTDKFTVKVALADAAADNPHNLAPNGVFFSPRYGALILGEADYTPAKKTELMAGAWHLTSQLPDWGVFNPNGTQHMTWGETGAYVGATTRLIDNGGFKGLDAFFTYGVSTPQSTNVAHSLNGGLTYTGLFASRPEDKFGMSVALNNASSNWRRSQAIMGNNIGDYETSFELTYRTKLSKYVTLQPDIQYVVHPSYSLVTKNAFVIGLHLEVGDLFQW